MTPIRSVHPLGIRARRTTVALCLLAALALATGPATGARLEGVGAPDRIQLEGTPLVLHRMALFRWMRVLKVYVASLYLPPDAAPVRVLDDVAKRLEIHYFRGFTAEQFRTSTSQLIARNVTASTLPSLRPRIERLNRLYRNVEPGDRYAISYAPGYGTELALNGTPLGRVEGADFAAAVFSIWLGKAPFDETLKRNLLEAP